MEAASGNALNIHRNFHFRFVPKIPNQASAARVNQKITPHFQKSISRIDNNTPKSRISQRQTSYLTNVLPNANRLK
jgi:hypothetical protein